jgi:hypothetical protein
LANVAAGLVALRSNGVALPRQVREAMVNPAGDDLWSPIMLAKFGPSGYKWDPQLLAAMGHHQLYRIDERGTYRDLDPMRAILAKVGESGAASRALLGNEETGVSDANMLMRASALYQKNHFDGLPGIDDVAGRILVSAAQVERGHTEEARQAAQAVANLISANHRWLQEKGGLGLGLPAGVRHGMTRVAGLYLSDLAMSSTNPYAGVEVKSLGREPWNVYVDHQLTKEFLSEALKDPRDFGWLKGKARAYVSMASALSALHHDNRTYAAESADFLGLLRRIDSEQGIAKGHEKDVNASAFQSTLDTLNNLIGLIPGERIGALAVAAGRQSLGKGVEVSLAHAGDAKTLADFFMKSDPSAESEARAQAIRATAQERFGMSALIVEGLIHAGKVRAPEDSTVYRDGHVIPGRNFQYWYAHNGAKPIHVGGAAGHRDDIPMTLSQYVDQLAGRFGDVADWV